MRPDITTIQLAYRNMCRRVWIAPDDPVQCPNPACWSHNQNVSEDATYTAETIAAIIQAAMRELMCRPSRAS